MPATTPSLIITSSLASTFTSLSATTFPSSAGPTKSRFTSPFSVPAGAVESAFASALISPPAWTDTLSSGVPISPAFATKSTSFPASIAGFPFAVVSGFWLIESALTATSSPAFTFPNSTSSCASITTSLPALICPTVKSSGVPIYTPPFGASAFNSPPTSTCRYLFGSPTFLLAESKFISFPALIATPSPTWSKLPSAEMLASFFATICPTLPSAGSIAGTYSSPLSTKTSLPVNNKLTLSPLAFTASFAYTETFTSPPMSPAGALRFTLPSVDEIIGALTSPTNLFSVA